MLQIIVFILRIFSNVSVLWVFCFKCFRLPIVGCVIRSCYRNLSVS